MSDNKDLKIAIQSALTPFVLRTLPPNENHIWGKPSFGSFLRDECLFNV